MSSVDSIWADMKKESNIVLQPKTSKIGFVSEKACNSSQEKKKKSSNKSSQKKDKKSLDNQASKVTKSTILAEIQTPSHTPSETTTDLILKVRKEM
jgi:hypothetical protein